MAVGTLTPGADSAEELAELALRLRREAEACEQGAGADAAPCSIAALRRDAGALIDHPALQRLLGSAGTEGGRAPDASGSPSPRWHIRLMGEFSVTLDGRDVTPARGNGAAIVKLLALRGPMTADAVIDLLWPVADRGVGSARLRNTLSRLRRTTGDVAIRRNGLLMVHPGATVDAADFFRAASTALHDRRAGRGTVSTERITDALAAFGGELLPGDRYVDWYDQAREQVVRRYLELSDAAQADAERRGDLDEAARVLEMALAVDPFDERRAVRLARHLVDLGHRAAGRWAIERALTVTRELGLVPSDELCRVAAAATTGSERQHPSFRSMTA